MDEFKQLLLDKTEALEQFRDQMTAFEGEWWNKMLEIFEQAEKGLVDNMLESDNGKVESTKDCIRMLRVFKNMPEVLKGAMEKGEAEVDELKKAEILFEAEEQALTGGEL